MLCNSCQFVDNCISTKKDVGVCDKYTRCEEKNTTSPVDNFILLIKALYLGNEVKMSTGHTLVMTEDDRPAIKLVSESGQVSAGVISWDVVFEEAKKLNELQVVHLTSLVALNS